MEYNLQNYQIKLFLNFLKKQAPKYEELVSSILKNTIYCLDIYFHDVLFENLDNIFKDYYSLLTIKNMLIKQIDYMQDIIGHCNIPHWLPIEKIINNCEIDLSNEQIIKCNNLVLYTELSLKKLVSICAPILSTACAPEDLINMINLLMLKNNFKKSSGEELCIVRIPYQS